MKRNGKSIILSIFLVVSVITAIPLFNLTIADNEPSFSPQSAALQDDLGVRVGDMIYCWRQYYLRSGNVLSKWYFI